jgi:repressor LexA
MLTRKQYQLLIFIDQRLRESGVAPSFEEMKNALGLKSKSGIHRLMVGLEERGFIRRLPHKARALEIMRLPENSGPRAGPVASSPVVVEDENLSPNVILGRFKPVRKPSTEPSKPVTLPLYGKIAAGTPIEALRDHSASIDVPGDLIGSGEYYALEVDGTSMIDAGIHDGDTAIIERTETAENGTIVVALVDNEEVTLKRLRRRGQSIALEPANPAFKTRICGPDQVKVQGRLAALIRRY